MAWLAGPVAALTTGDPRPRLCALWPGSSRGFLTASLCPGKGERMMAGRGDLGQGLGQVLGHRAEAGRQALEPDRLGSNPC